VTQRPLTVDDAQSLRFVRDAGFVGDGRHGYFTVAEVVDDRDRHSLWLFDLAGEGSHRLAETLEDVSSPQPSPDGTTFALLSQVDGKQQIHLVPVDGRELRVLTSVPQGVTGPLAWSPDGSRIAYGAWSTISDVFVRVHIIAADGTGDRELPRSRANFESTPIWSNDGKQLLIVRGYGDLSGAMYGAVVPADGQSAGIETEKPLILAGGGAIQDWSPDDSQVLATLTESPTGAPVQQVAWDPATGRISGVSWHTISAPAWQRLAR
jgi:Tol biopolymer transport system component